VFGPAGFTPVHDSSRVFASFPLSSPHDPASRAAALESLFSLSGQTAIVTGGLGRLGSQYVATLARAGARVAALDITAGVPPPLSALVDDGWPVSIHRVDLTNRTAVEAVLADVAGEAGTPTILVNNAGLGASPSVAAGEETGPFEDYPEAAWDAMMASHLKAALLVTQAFIRRYRAARAEAGSIVNVSSTYGLVTPEQAIYEYKRRSGATYVKPVGYSVAKAGMLNFTRWLAEYGAPLGLRANTLVPGGVREAGHDPTFVAEYERRTMLGRMATDEDYNGAVLFLASRASAYMTGATLVVDGGWTAR
jgi:NAD(P)-dependent dehydrogenase (short-subunit alcohol dehydrogenase family)